MALEVAESFSFWKRSPPLEHTVESEGPLYQIPGQECQAALRIPCLQAVGGTAVLETVLGCLRPPTQIDRRILLFYQTQLAFLQGAGPLEAYAGTWQCSRYLTTIICVAGSPGVTPD